MLYFARTNFVPTRKVKKSINRLQNNCERKKKIERVEDQHQPFLCTFKVYLNERENLFSRLSTVNKNASGQAQQYAD